MLVPTLASAQALAPAPSSPVAQSSRPVVVIVRIEEAVLAAARVRAAVASEIGAPAIGPEDPSSAGARGTLTVTLHTSLHELAVTYRDEARGTVVRVVAAPEKIDDVPGAAALLAGNMIRDEADDLLGGLRPAPPAPPPAAPPPPPQAPPPGPAAPANVGIFYPLALNYGHPDLRTHFDLNLIYGRIGALDGLEIGTVSTVNGDMTGAQLALAANVVGGRAEGLQAAAVNVSEDLTGLQLGVVNFAHRVRGVQLGVFNVADDVDGIPIGLVSVTRTGGVHPTAWFSNSSYANVGIKFATKYTYTILSGSWQPDRGRDLFGPGFTVGAHVPALERFFVDFDLGATHLFGGKLCCGSSSALRQNDVTLVKLRAMVVAALAPHLSIYAGGGVTATVRYPLDAAGETSASAQLGPEYFAGIEF